MIRISYVLIAGTEKNNIKAVVTPMSENNNEEFEEICYMCRRPESVAGKMIHIQENICICNDCMQKTFDTMNSGRFNMGDMFAKDSMPNISMVNLSDLMGGIPQSQKV